MMLERKKKASLRPYLARKKKKENGTFMAIFVANQILQHCNLFG